MVQAAAESSMFDEDGAESEGGAAYTATVDEMQLLQSSGGFEQSDDVPVEDGDDAATGPRRSKLLATPVARASALLLLVEPVRQAFATRAGSGTHRSSSSPAHNAADAFRLSDCFQTGH